MTEPLNSQTSSDETVDLLEELIAVKEHRDQLWEMLKWNTAVLNVILQEAGGVIEISLDDVENVDISKVNTLLKFDEDRRVVIVEGVFG